MASFGGYASLHDTDTPATSDADTLDTSDIDTPDTSDAETLDTSDTDTFSDELPAVTTAGSTGRACTGPERRCWLCTELTPWNQVMQGLSFELVELRPGKLGLRSNPQGNLFIERDHAPIAAAASFSWLLQHHRCIEELKVAYGVHLNFREKSTPFPVSLRPAAGSDFRCTLRGLEIEQSASAWLDIRKGDSRDCFELVGLDVVGGLEKLKLDFSYIKPKLAAELAKLLRRNASSIKRFEISGVMEPRQVSHALRHLFSCESLTIASHHGCFDRLPSVSSVVRLMRSSTALKELSIASIGSSRHISAIAKELETNTSLTKLSVQMVKITVWSCSPEALFTALQVNTTLRELRVTNWHMSDECGQALASLLRKNTGLRVLHFGDVDISELCLFPMAVALIGNTTLESLHISSETLPTSGILSLCQALGSNKTLKKLVLSDLEVADFGFIDLPEPRAVLARQLTEDDCYGRVQLPWTEHDLPGLTAALISSFAGFEELRLPDISSLSATGLKQLFDALASNECVHTLGVCVMEDPGEQGTALCEMLKVNRSIQCLDLAIDKDEYKFVEEMSHALAENTAITKIMLRFDSLREFETATALSYLLAHNKTASKFFLRSSSGFCDGFVGEFTQGMLQNKTIVKLRLGRNSFCNSVNFPLFEAVHRNRGALNRAVDFVVSPSLDRQCAEGFEWFSGRPCLLKYLKKVTGKTEPEALLAIAAAEHYLRDNYLLITGIVQHSVKCHPSKGTQVDALNKDCWLAIVRHLKIADVLA